MTGVLPDTHVALQVLGDDPRLGTRARECILDAPRIMLSVASVWELAIKHAVGKFPDPRPVVTAARAAAIEILPITADHALAIDGLDLPHRDPFDRLLVTQARVEGAAFLTNDAAILSAGLAAVLDARQ